MKSEINEDNFFEEDEDIYKAEFRAQLLEDDEITTEEEGFMRGYYEEE
ncbi:hypothetical protein HYT58_00350 [Candidatus Woesearchaeota archaeon]|nr:hypothetical protein [Candidatus Woesearchaeota archaeon]